ncbi:NADPH-dependent FMN reductase [Micromonospora sp. NPDC049559]|uniref:NADPH-dependent FMN reductase n=1 Tax=Micromonospora sp. NPDC049559 TaxID=3155923 RepID=UPI003449A421
MLKIAIVVGSVRPGRAGMAVANWVYEVATRHGGATYEIIDLRDVDLPPMDEEVPPMLGQYARPHTQRWADRIRPFDGYVFVTPEYNHGMPAALKNAIDFLYAEWNNKAAGFVSYGSEGGVRAVEQLRQVVAQVRIADVGASVPLSLATDFVDFTQFRPQESREQLAHAMLGELVEWSGALRAVRAGAHAGQAA